MNYYMKEYRYKFANKLRSMSTKSPKQYWRFLNGITQKKQNLRISTPFMIILSLRTQVTQMKR